MNPPPTFYRSKNWEHFDLHPRARIVVLVGASRQCAEVHIRRSGFLGNQCGSLDSVLSRQSVISLARRQGMAFGEFARYTVVVKHLLSNLSWRPAGEFQKTSYDVFRHTWKCRTCRCCLKIAPGVGKLIRVRRQDLVEVVILDG